MFETDGIGHTPSSLERYLIIIIIIIVIIIIMRRPAYCFMMTIMEL